MRSAIPSTPPPVADRMKLEGSIVDKYKNNFDGKRFQNVPDRPQAEQSVIFKWLLNRDAGAWDDPVDEAPLGPPPPDRVGAGERRVTFINHSTVLIQIDGLNILTDPIFSKRASPVSWAGPRRVRPPGIKFEDLPSIDAVLLSHNHYDHMCLSTLKRLRERDTPEIYTGLGNGQVLARIGFEDVVEMDWWDSNDVLPGITVTFVPAQHFSARGVFDRQKTLWGGFYISTPNFRIYFVGDSGEGPHFEDVRDVLGPPDLAMIPIGAFRPSSVMSPVHISPKEAVDVHQRLGAHRSMAIHFGTFRLADDGQYEPIELLDKALNEASLTRDDFWVLDFGEGRDVAG